ncbi:MAG TPA: hypothetical protein VJ505_03750 [Holophagaceae bacterium]|nr:hypothetical protein [Holophagaceae bacterium]
MIQRVGSTSTYGTPEQGPAPGVLQAQLSKVEGQLQDCVNCDSAPTPEGQAKIQALARQAQSLKARLEAAQRNRPLESPPPAAAPPTTSAPPVTEGRLDLLA